MEEEASSRRSVAELVGRFKGSTPAHDAAGHEMEKPVRRRPPRSLQLPKPDGDDQEPPGVTSPGPVKAKRNSALIEKLQSSLALSPAALLPSPKSPGIRLLPTAFTSPSPGSTPVTTGTNSSAATPTTPITTSPLTEQEGPASFEAPPTVGEGSILSNDSIKGRARHSIRRRPPSRRHRKSSNGDEVGVANEGGDVPLSSPSEAEDKTRGGEGGDEKEGGEEVFTQEGKTDEVKEDKPDASTCPDKNESREEDCSEISTEPSEEDKNGSTGGKDEDQSSSGRKEEEEEEKMEEEAQEKSSGEKQEEGLTEGATNTDSKEEEKVEETTSQCSVR